MKAKNITRYTYAKTAFQGWRLSIARQGKQFTKYFSDKQFENNSRMSFRAAINMRDDILKDLKAQRTAPDDIFTKYKPTIEVDSES